MAAGRPVVSTEPADRRPVGEPGRRQRPRRAAGRCRRARGARSRRLGDDAALRGSAWRRRTQPCGRRCSRASGWSTRSRASSTTSLSDAASRARGRRRAGRCAVSAASACSTSLLSGAGLLASAPLWAAHRRGHQARLRRARSSSRRRASAKADGISTRSSSARWSHDAEADVGPVQATLRDPRVTRVGRVLRATAMDELPQLWNIFRGDMSFVGPRALRPERDRACRRRPGVPLEAVPASPTRCTVTPGLTGIAQIYAPPRRDAPPEVPLRSAVCPPAFALLDLRLILLSFWITDARHAGKPGSRSSDVRRDLRL